MSKKKFIDAMGDIDNEFLEEYSSYVPKKRVQVYTVVKVLAACLALVLCAGAVWVGNDRSGQNNQDIVADEKNNDEGNMIKETLSPEDSGSPKQDKASESPVMAIITTQEPEVVASEEVLKKEIPMDDIQDDEKKNNNLPDTDCGINAENKENQNLPTEPVATQGIDQTEVEEPTESVDKQEKVKQLKPAESAEIVVASNWNAVNKGLTPCGAEIMELKYWKAEVDDYVRRNSNSSATNTSSGNGLITDGVPDAFTAGMITVEKDGIAWDAERLSAAPVVAGWLWFDTDALVWEKEYVLQREKEKANALSNVLLVKEDATMYIIQTKTTAKTLEEANTMYPEEIFGSNLKATNINGVLVYFIENSNGEYYVRFLVDDVFVTIIDKGFSKDVLEEMMKTVKMTF